MSEVKLNPIQVGKSLQKLKVGVKSSYNDGKPKSVILKINTTETELQILSKGLLTTSTLAKLSINDIESMNFTEGFKFSLIYTGNKSYDFEAGNKDEFESSTPGLSFLVRERHLSKDKNAMDLLILKRWMKADTNLDGKLDLKEIAVLCYMLNVNIDIKNLRKKFEAFDNDKSGTLEFEEFVDFFKDLMKKPELEEIFVSFNSNYLYKSHFQKFLLESQGEELNDEKTESLMKEVFASETENGLGLNLYDFTRFLFSKQNSAYDPIGKTIHQDMSKPLAQYYMKSSHNTYLSGNQLTGASSVDMYQKALELGCRCVEIDCWDGPNGDPIVTHGHTLTSKIRFEDVIKCVNTYAFKVTPYPLVLSLEVHTNEEQQIKMAKYIKDIMGDKLYTNEIKNAFPSPDDLKGKILVKNKKLKNPNSNEIENDDEEEEEEENNESGEKIVKTTSFMKKDETKKEVKKEKKKLAKELSDITIFDSGKLKSWTEKEEIYQMHSFSETKLSKFVKKEPGTLIDYTKKQFLRIYPKGTRITSTNLDPVESWAHGCQMVAFNYQTYDYPMRLNLLKFIENGTCGYILKPPTLIDPNAQEQTQPYTLKVSIISGEQIPRPGNTEKGDMVDPYVSVTLIGKTQLETFKTKVVYDEGFHPVWKEKFEFKVPNFELSGLYFSVFDKNTVKDEFIGDAYVPLKYLRMGYRNIELYDINFKVFEYSKIFCSFQLEK